MIREAGPEDVPAVEAIQLRNVGAAMFPLSNLRAYGLARRGFAEDRPNAMRACRAIGFRPAQSFALVLFATPVLMPT